MYRNNAYNIYAIFSHYNKCTPLLALGRSRCPTNGYFLVTILYVQRDWLVFKLVVFANNPLVLQRMDHSCRERRDIWWGTPDQHFFGGLESIFRNVSEIWKRYC